VELDDYTTETDAIRTEAAIWRTAASDLEAPANTARSLVLTTADIGITADGQGFGGTYEQLRQRIQTLLDGGRQSYDNIGTTLVRVATTYDAQELINVDRMSSAGEGLGES
jgi:hypothetical protein